MKTNKEINIIDIENKMIETFFDISALAQLSTKWLDNVGKTTDRQADQLVNITGMLQDKVDALKNDIEMLYKKANKKAA